MKIIFISDIHLGRKDDADDFHDPTLTKERRLIKIFQSDADIVIVGGDFTDGWETNIDRIICAYWNVFQAIKDRIRDGKVVIFIKGNHDAVKGFPFPYVEISRIGDYVFLHGHQFDVFNSKWKWIGKTFTKIGSFIERLGWRNIDKLWNKLERGRFGSNESYFGMVERWVDKNPEYYGKNIIFGFGHTHQYTPEPVQLRNCKVMNAGTWTGDNMNILELEVEE